MSATPTPKELTREAKIAMLEALRTGSLNAKQEATLRSFLEQGPIVLKYCGTAEEAQQIIDSIPNPT